MNEIESYLDALTLEDRTVMNALRSVIVKHLPAGFEEQFSYGMIGYVVPHAVYPTGYHVDPTLPLPFVAIARQKNAYTLYHMGLYGNPELTEWFRQSYAQSYGRLDCGKSCFRFKTKEKIPYDLIGILMEKISVEDYIRQVETTLSVRRR